MVNRHKWTKFWTLNFKFNFSADKKSRNVIPTSFNEQELFQLCDEWILQQMLQSWEQMTFVFVACGWHFTVAFSMWIICLTPCAKARKYFQCLTLTCDYVWAPFVKQKVTRDMNSEWVFCLGIVCHPVYMTFFNSWLSGCWLSKQSNKQQHLSVSCLFQHVRKARQPCTQC